MPHWADTHFCVCVYDSVGAQCVTHKYGFPCFKGNKKIAWRAAGRAACKNNDSITLRMCHTDNGCFRHIVPNGRYQTTDQQSWPLQVDQFREEHKDDTGFIPNISSKHL